MKRDTGVPDEIKNSLLSENPVSRGWVGIFELASGGYEVPELVEPLLEDESPFMFGMPVSAAAHAYLDIADRSKQEGPLDEAARRMAAVMRDEWGKGCLLARAD